MSPRFKYIVDVKYGENRGQGKIPDFHLFCQKVKQLFFRVEPVDTKTSNNLGRKICIGYK